jgi:hypothetical protein
MATIARRSNGEYASRSPRRPGEVSNTTWAKLDDGFHAHRKAKRAWRNHPRALGLHLLAVSYCASQLTDGFVDNEFIEEKLPAARERAAVTAALVDAGLWTAEEDGWRIHDWLDFNPSRAEVLGRRRKDSERKQSARVRRESERSPDGQNGDVHPESDPRPSDPSRPRAFPDPTRPDPTSPPRPPAGGRARDKEDWKKEAISYARAVGVDGEDESLVRAVYQASAYTSVRSPEEFRRFAGQHFDSLTVAQEAV